MDEIRLIVNDCYNFEFEDGAVVTEDVWHELPWGGRFSTYEIGRYIDCGPKVYKTYISFENLPGRFEATNFDPGTIYVLSPEGAKQLGSKVGNDLSNIALPDKLDRESIKRLLDEVFFNRYPRERTSLYWAVSHLTPTQRLEYYTTKGFRRLMRQITKRQVALLVLRWGLDGQQPRLLKDIGPLLVPAIKKSRTSWLHEQTLSELRQVVLRDHPKDR